MSFEDPQREAIAAVAFAAAWADGQVGDEEKQALDRILSRLGYKRSEIMARIGAALEGPKSDVIEVPVDEASAIEVMRYALAVTLADGMLSQDEVNFLVTLAAHLGINSSTLSALGQEAQKLLGSQPLSGPKSSANRVEVLLPEARVSLVDLEIEHKPEPREEVSEDLASRTALSHLLYQGEGFGGAVDL
jgi:tellurite resistance protein